jgi:tetratricopeptide (TPR) repeat protein
MDLQVRRQSGSDQEFLIATLYRDPDGDALSRQDFCSLPPHGAKLGETGLTVAGFLSRWRESGRNLEAAAKHYGRLLHRHLFEEGQEIRDAWSQATREARGRGLRLEIRLPDTSAASWQGQHIGSLPFELLCDENGFLFRRAGWSTIRRPSQHSSRSLRYDGAAAPRVQVAWANVTREDGRPLDEALFRAHDDAVAGLAAQQRAERLAPLPQATRPALRAALETHRPHVLVWVGHGLSDGSGLLLHDGKDPTFPGDRGAVVGAGDFARDARGGEIDLALLWSCHGAGSQRPLDVGVAEALLDPDGGDAVAVLAAFSALEAPAAAQLSAELITALGRSTDGDLETALRRAREGLDEHSLSWARPVLFLRTPRDTRVRLGLTSPAPAPALADTGGAGRRLRWLPQQQLQPTAHYIDEQARLDGLTEDLRHHPIVVLEGIAGLGKTELALALAERRRAIGEDVAFIDVTGDRDIGRLQKTLGLLVRERPFETRDELLAALHGLRWTLVLDNAEDLLPDKTRREELLALLRDLRATGPEFRAVITSRHALAPPERAADVGLFTREVAPLGLSEARQLFIQAAGPRLAPTQAVPEVLDPLLTALGGNARATLLMAGQLGDGVDVTELLRRLKADGANAIVEHEIYGEAVPGAFDAKLHKIRLTSALNLSLAAAAKRVPQSAILFDALGAFPAGLAQAWLPHDAHPWLADALSALLEHHLIELAGEARRVRMAAPVRLHAWTRLRQRLAEAKTDETADLLRHAREALAREAYALSALLGSEHSAQVLIAIDQDRPNLLLTLDAVVDALPDPEAEAQQLSPILIALVRAAEYGGQAARLRAELQTVLARMLPAGPGTRATALFWSGRLALRTDDLVGAAEAYAAALPLYRQIEDRLGEANTLKALGDLKRRTSDLVGAAEAYAAALPLYRQIEDRLGEANTLKALGDLKRRTSDLVGAAEAYAAALPLYRQIEDRLGEANTLQMLGQLALAEGDPRAAFRQTLQALRLQEAIEDRLGQGAAHGYLARIALHVGALAHGTTLTGRAGGLFLAIGDRYGQMIALQTLGPPLLAQAPTEGLACLLQAQALAREIGDPRAERIQHMLDAMFADQANDEGFIAAIAELRTRAPHIIAALFEHMEAAVARGELDPYTLPPQAGAEETRDDGD